MSEILFKRFKVMENMESTSQIHALNCLLYSESCLSDIACIGIMLIQIWLKSVKKYVSGKQVYALNECFK